jgi:hypothetical protein
MAALAYTYVFAMRLLLAELPGPLRQLEPTPLFLDATSVLNGVECERLRKSSRWLATRYALLRWGLACRTITLEKVLSALNPANGLTKALVGDAFLQSRAFLLGLPPEHPASTSF